MELVVQLHIITVVTVVRGLKSFLLNRHAFHAVTVAALTAGWLEVCKREWKFAERTGPRSIEILTVSSTELDERSCRGHSKFI